MSLAETWSSSFPAGKRSSKLTVIIFPACRNLLLHFIHFQTSIEKTIVMCRGVVIPLTDTRSFPGLFIRRASSKK